MADTFADRYDQAADRVRRKHDEGKSAADRLRDRLKYAADLRRKSKAAYRVADRLNDWMQRQDSGGKRAVLKRNPSRKFATFMLGPSEIELTAEEVESLFTWMLDHSRKLEAHADKIEAELAAPVAESTHLKGTQQ